MNIGFIGLGLMGEPMARRLVAAQSEVTVFNRNPSSALRLATIGAHVAEGPRQLAECDVVFTMLPDLPETISLLEDSLLDEWSVRPTSSQHLIVVMSSVSPTAVRRYAHAVHARTHGGAAVVDAPVSGGVSGAEAGALSIMVGSTKEQFERLATPLTQLGSVVRRMGEVGAGSVAKACNQLVVGTTAAALSEAIVVAEQAGIDASDMLDLLAGGLAGSRLLDDKRDKLLTGDYSTSGAARYMLRNLDALIESAREAAVTTPIAKAVRELFARLVADGFGDLDLIAVRAEIRQLSGLDPVATSLARAPDDADR